MSANYTAQPGGVSGFQPVLGSDWPSVASKSLSTDSTGGDNPFDWSPPVKASTTTTKPDLDLGNTAKVLPLTTHNLKKKGGSTKRPKAAPLVCYTDSDCGSSSSSEDPETADTSLDTFDASMELVNLSSTDEKDQPMPHPGGLAKPASNDFNTRFWKPSSNEWDDSKLYNPILEAYECPHLDCRSVMIFFSIQFHPDSVLGTHKSTQRPSKSTASTSMSQASTDVPTVSKSSSRCSRL